MNIQEMLFQNSPVPAEHLAIIAKDGCLTYGELHRYATGLAERIAEQLILRRGNNTSSACIGVCMERRVALLPAVLAIFWLGATYLPLDPGLPACRKRYIAEDAGMDLLLTDSPEQIAGLEGVCPMIVVPAHLPEGGERDWRKVALDDCAYIIYTSGTTGTPKGVQITYGNLSAFSHNLLHMQTEHLNRPDYKYLAFASISFDASVLEWMMCLPGGGTLVLAGEAERRDSVLLAELIRREAVNVAFLPPSLLAVMPDLAFPAMKTLLFGAEAISEKLFRYLLEHPYLLINLYGPTENTVVSTFCVDGRTKTNDNIGCPLPGVTCFVLNEDLQSVEYGVTGELYLGGTQVSSGYLRREELNRQVFIDYDGERLYRTGDLVRQSADGSLRFMGRKDTQVKVNGFRIELNEIIRQLDKDPEVEKSWVCLLCRDERQWLGAYVQPIRPQDFVLETVKERLRKQLPSYMIPHQWQVINHFSRTLNDKIDISSLPPFPVKGEDYVPPVHPGESRLCAVLKEILGLTEVSVKADFIHDLGMTSIDVLNFTALAGRQGYPVSVSAVYTARNVRQLLSTPVAQPVYWYREQRPGYPVVVLVCGAAYFNHLYFPFADRLYRKYDILVIDAVYDHFLQVAPHTPGLLVYYATTVCPLIAGRQVEWLTGFCMGGELALGLAVHLYEFAGILPPVAVLDGQARIDPLFYQNYPSLVFPGESEEMNRKRYEIIRLYFHTAPHLVYRGKVVVFLAGLFHWQAGISPDEPWTVENRRIFREEYDRCGKLWRLYYPEAPGFRLPADH